MKMYNEVTITSVNRYKRNDYYAIITAVDADSLRFMRFRVHTSRLPKAQRNVELLINTTLSYKEISDLYNASADFETSRSSDCGRINHL